MLICYSGQEIGPFRAVEESTIAWLIPKEDRSDIYAWYSLVGTAGLAAGTISCGWFVESLLQRKAWETVRAYRAVFYIYSVLGIIKMLLALMLSRKCEVEKSKSAGQSDETSSLLPGTDAQPVKPKKKMSFLPSIARDSLPTVIKLALLFGVDSFASGLVSMYVVGYSTMTGRLLTRSGPGRSTSSKPNSVYLPERWVPYSSSLASLLLPPCL